jgi:hypothetical protein
VYKECTKEYKGDQGHKTSEGLEIEKVRSIQAKGKKNQDESEEQEKALIWGVCGPVLSLLDTSRAYVNYHAALRLGRAPKGLPPANLRAERVMRLDCAARGTTMCPICFPCSKNLHSLNAISRISLAGGGTRPAWEREK